MKTKINHLLGAVLSLLVTVSPTQAAPPQGGGGTGGGTIYYVGPWPGATQGVLEFIARASEASVVPGFLELGDIFMLPFSDTFSGTPKAEANLSFPGYRPVPIRKSP
jgi:hypothetical protein